MLEKMEFKPQVYTYSSGDESESSWWAGSCKEPYRYHISKYTYDNNRGWVNPYYCAYVYKDKARRYCPLPGSSIDGSTQHDTLEQAIEACETYHNEEDQ